MRSVIPLVLLCASCALAQAPSSEELFREAQKAQESGDYELAVRKYQELVRSHPEVVAARANLGVALVSLGRFDEAIEQYRAALEQVPGNRDLRLNLALAYYKSGKYSDASDQLRDLLKGDSGNVRMATLLSDCYLRLARDPEVIPLLLPFERADPQNLAVAWALGSAMIHVGRNQEGLERISKVAKQSQLPEAYALAAEAHLRLEEFNEARQAAETAMQLNPNLPGIYTLSGMVREYASDLEGAEASYRKATEAKADDFEARMRLGAVLFELRKLDEARKELEVALKLNPDSAYARFEMAKVENAQGQTDAATKDFERVEQQIPQWILPHVELTALYYRLKRKEDGAREKQIVDQLTEEERQHKTQTRVILPELPLRQESGPH